MIEQQLINDYAKRETLLGTELVEIIFGASVCTLEESLKAHLFYPNLPSEIKPKEINAYASLVKGMVARFSTSPNENTSKEQLLNIKINVQVFCPWLLEKVREMPDFALSHSARLFVDIALGTNVQSTNPHEKMKEAKDPTPFIKSLRIYCENDIEIKIQAPTKQPITCNPDSLGFRNKETDQWKYLIGLLQSAGGTFSYSRKEGTKKSAWREIEKKLRAFLNSKFGLNLPNDFKLFSSTQEAGVRKPIFQIHKPEDKNREDFSTLGKDQIAEKIRELSISPDTKTADLLNKAVARAEELGFSQLEMVGMLKTDDFLPSEISSLYNVDSTLLIKDRPDIDGKQQKPERNNN